MQNRTGVRQVKAKVLPFTHEAVAQVAAAIRADHVVGMPTETVYGLAGNGKSPQALARIFSTKERPTFDPLILHVDAQSVKNLRDLEDQHLVDGRSFSDLNRKLINRLIEVFWPGPLTLVLPKHPDVPDLATSGLPTVALRMPKHPVAQALIQAAQTPLAAPSANRFGRISPTTAEAVAEELGDKIEWILDGGPCEIGLESTILLVGDTVEILRHGGLSQETLEELFRREFPDIRIEPKRSHSIVAPGMLESHYAPTQPFILLPKPINEMTSAELTPLRPAGPEKGSIGLLIQKGDPKRAKDHLETLVHAPVICYSLSPSGDLSEAAHLLFSQMRKLDSAPVSFIWAEPCFISQGLGHAIQDRLKRASAHFRSQQNLKSGV